MSVGSEPPVVVLPVYFRRIPYLKPSFSPLTRLPPTSPCGDAHTQEEESKAKASQIKPHQPSPSLKTPSPAVKQVRGEDGVRNFNY